MDNNNSNDDERIWKHVTFGWDHAVVPQLSPAGTQHDDEVNLSKRRNY